MEAKGISLHIGLNYVDPNHYSGWDGELTAAEYDANDMQLIAESQRFKPELLLRSEATRDAVKSAINKAAEALSGNDIFLITYSGHGGQLPDLNSDEADGIDETWCLFDGQLMDDELYELWSNFNNGTRILILSDSCHSGTIARFANNLEVSRSGFTRKFAPDAISSNTYFRNKIFYDNIQKGIKKNFIEDIVASVKLISGCQDNQYSYDGAFNGQFTGALKRVWNGGKFSGNYAAFHKQIQSALPPDQSPNYFNIGLTNLGFDNQKPFTIRSDE